MAMTLTPEHDYEEVPTSGRRRKVTKFALAGIAVLGVGAALTSAAWTDDVFFGGSASSGTAELDGSTNNTDFVAGESGNVDLVIADFVIGPNSSDTHRVWVKNTGDLELRLATIDPQGSGPLFEQGASITAISNDADGILKTGQKASIDVEVTGNPAWSGSFMEGQLSADNSIVVHVQGSTDLVGP